MHACSVQQCALSIFSHCKNKINESLPQNTSLCSTVSLLQIIMHIDFFLTLKALITTVADDVSDFFLYFFFFFFLRKNKARHFM